ncbi:MAG: ROK family protein [Caldilineaceae bacterium]
MRYYIGVDLGGTNLRTIKIDKTGEIYAHHKVRSEAKAGPEPLIQQIARQIEETISETPRQEIAGVGIGVPGPADPILGIVYQAVALTGWIDIPLQARLQELIKLPVQVGNDANVAAVGEWQFGAGRGCQHFVYVTVSTGIGGGVIADGRLLLGRKGMAAEVGHVIVDPKGPRCSCGDDGCWEAHASGTSFGRTANAALASAPTSQLHQLAQAGPLTGKEVIAAAQQGDPLALRLVEEEGRWLGIGMRNLLHLYSPERIAVGGGLSNALPLFLPYIESTIRVRAMLPYRDVPVVAAALGDNAGLIGAAALLMTR